MACSQIAVSACLRGMVFGLTLVRVNDQFDLVSSSFRRSFGTIGSCALTSQSNVNHFMLRICIMSGSKKKETRTSHEWFLLVIPSSSHDSLCSSSATCASLISMILHRIFCWLSSTPFEQGNMFFRFLFS